MKTRLLVFLFLAFGVKGFAQPHATFSNTALDTSGVLHVCAGDAISFTNFSTAQAGATYLWTFGGGGTPASSIVSSPTITFNTNGSYSCSFQVTDASGVDDTLFTVVVSNATTTPTWTPSTYCSSDPVSLLTNGSPAGGTYAGPGVTGGGIYFNPGIGAGVYTLTYYYTNAGGCVDSVQGNITVVEGPTALLAEANNYSNCNGFTLPNPNFTVSVFDGSTGTILNYQIIWGDGTPSYNSAVAPSNLNHTYFGQGIYTLNYIVTSANGCTDTVTYEVLNTSNPASLNVINPGNTNGCAPLVVNFPLTTTNTDTSIIYTVDFGDGTDTTFPHPPPAFLLHTYDSTSCLLPNAVYTITATATNACLSTQSTVNGPFITEPAVADFIPDGDSIGCVNQPFNFQNISIPGFNNACNRFMTYIWDYGDGSPRDTQVVFSPTPPGQTHTYTNVGNYNVTLWARSFGQTFCDDDSITIPICIDDAPVNQFSVNPDTGCAPLVVSTTNTSYSPGFCLGFTSFWSVTPATGWVLSGLDSLNQTNPTFIFNEMGSYTLTLTTTNDCGTTVRDTTIIVQERPVVTLPADVSYCDTTQIDFATDPLHLPVYVENLSPITQYNWDITPKTYTFLNGTDSTSQYPEISFAPNVYQVIVCATNSCGTDCDTQLVDVNARPIVDFSLYPICQNDTVFFFDSTFVDPVNGNPLSTWFWDFGNGQTSTLQNPFAIYASPGIYTVTLRVQDTEGCVDSLSKSVTIHDAPLAAFTFDTVCAGSANTFTDLSSFSAPFGAPITAWSWDFDDGSPVDNNQNPTHTFPAAGLYDVQLTVTDTNGCFDDTIIEVLVRANPIALFVPPINCIGDSIQFTDSSYIDSTYGTPLVSWNWDFGDGSSSTTQNPAHRYVSTGSYWVTLTVTDSFGCTNTYQDSAIVSPLPVAGFSLSVDTGCTPLSVSFTNTSSPAISYTWRANGVVFSTQENPTEVFQNTSHTQDTLIVISLDILNAGGCRDTLLDTLTIFPEPLADAGFTLTSACSVDTLPVFNNSLSKSGSFLWSSGQSSVQINNPTDSFPTIVVPLNQSGFDSTYTFTLVVTSVDGCQDSIAFNFTNFTLPTALFSLDTAGCGPFSTAATDSSIAANVYAWTVSPAGVTISDPSIAEPTFDFPLNSTTNPIDYNVRLVVTTNNGCTDTLEENVRVYPGPTSGFTVSASDSCGPLTVSFSNISNPNDGTAINTLAFLWDFGNGITSTAQDTSILYTNSGTEDSVFVVSLQVTNLDGCTDTFVDTVTVYPNPHAELDVRYQLDCAPFVIDTNAVQAIHYPQANDTYTWRVLSTQGALLNTFNGRFAINYTIPLPNDSVLVQLITTNVHGCVNDTVEQLMYTIDDPVAAFSAAAYAGCAPFNVSLFDSSTVGVSHEWFMNGNSFSTQQNPNFTLQNTSPVNDSLVWIQLVVTAGTGCTDTVNDTLLVYPKPISDFSFVAQSLCAPDSIYVTNTSSFKPGSTYDWSVSSPAIQLSNPNSAVPNLYALDNQSGFDSTYTLSLIVTSPDGCSDTLDQDFTVFTRPVAGFTVDSATCGPATLQLNNTSLFATQYSWTVSPAATISNATAQDPTVDFPLNATTDSIVYTLRLTATSANGCIDTASQLVTVYPKPQANFAQSDTAICDSFSVSFTNSSNAFNGEPASSLTYTWDFGNGITANTADTTVVFRNTGLADTTYNIQLIVQSMHGCLDTVTSTVVVHPNPLAQFSAMSTGDCAPFVLDATNIQSVQYPNANDTYTWLANGVNIGSGPGFPGYTINGSGDTVIISLVTSNVHGCRQDTAEVLFYAIEDPGANFGYNARAACSPFALSLYDSSSVGVSHQWLINGVPFSTQANPTLTLINNSTQTDSIVWIQLQVTAGGSGCAAVANDTLTIWPTPVVDFSLSADVVCAPDTIQVSNNSGFKAGSGFAWSVSSPRIQVSNATVATPQFFIPDNQSGFDSVYVAQLIITSPDGCADTLTQDFKVFSRPVASFDVDSAVCGPTTLTSTNNSQFASQYAWSVSPAGTTISNPTAVAPDFTFPINTTTDSIVYSIRLTATSDSGCVDTAVQVVTVYPKPLASFAQSDTAVCDSSLINFTNSSNAFNGEPTSSLTYSWDFGNGISSSSADTSIVFRNTGFSDTTYVVQLIVQTQHGCSDTISSTVRVFPNPEALFTTVNTVDCAPFVIDSLNIQTVEYPNANDTYSWLANGVVLGSGPNFPGYTIANDGDTVVFTLITTNVHGCKPDTLSVQFRSIQDPVANFGASVYAGCAPLTVSFTDSSSAGVNYAWDFGNGQTSTLQNPTVNFIGTGQLDTTYTVQLITTLTGSGCSDTISKDVVVYGTPLAGFETNFPCQGDSVYFMDTSFSATHPIVSWLWDFGDGTTSTLQNPIHLFALGSYNITLTVTDTNGCTHTIIEPLVYRPSPVADIGIGYSCAPDSACVGDTVFFSDASTLAALGGTIVQWDWDVDNDGITDYTVQNPPHIYNATGIYTIRLLVTSNFGCTDTVYDSIQVSEPPQAIFTLDRDRGCGPLQISATEASTGLIRNYSWEIFTEDDNGNQSTVFSSTLQDPNPFPALQAAINRDTSYYVSLTVSNCCGASQQIDTVTVIPIPIPYFVAAIDSGCSPVNITFQTDGLVTGRPDSILFDFGDGSPLETLLPNISVQPNGDTILTWNQRSHVFVYNGTSRDTTYFVTLRAISECGDSTYTQPITVYPNNVQGFFNTSTNAGCAPLTISVNDFSFGASTLNWCSDFDTVNKVCNGALSAQTSPSFTYATPGTYIVALFASNDCSIDTVYQTVRVDPSPVANFSSNNFLCLGDTFSFTNQSTVASGTIAGYRWDFGDGDTSIQTNPSHVFTQEGSYSVCLQVISTNGCIDSICKTLNVNPPPNIGFSAVNICLNEQPLQFYDSTYVNGGIVISRVWDFGDGNTSTQVNPQHTYLAPGQYWVKLTALTDDFCEKTDSNLVSIYPIPITDFEFTRTGGDSCGAPQTLSFQNTSTGAAGFEWDFDLNNSGVNTSTLVSPTIVFNQAGIYTVRLIADNGFGCTDTILKEIRILPTPEINIDASLFEGCAPLTIEFEDLSNVFDTISGSSIIAWRWYFSDGTRSVLPDPTRTFGPGSYSVGIAIETNLGCFDSAWFPDLVRVYEPPEVDFQSELVSEGTVAFASMVSNGRPLYRYYWDFGDGDSAFTPNPIHKYFLNGTNLAYGYEVCLTVIDSNGCSDIHCDTISLGSNSMFVPNAMVFADGLAGTMASQFLPAAINLAEYHLRIYDRWGNLIWETTSLDPETGKPNEPWNGVHRGKPLPQGVYYWRIDGVFRDGSIYRGKEYDEDKRTNVGTITLVR